jgi:small subunit ribosomal protein S4e
MANHKKHLKRLRAPKSWMLSKLGGTWAPRPSAGPHKLRESIPIIVLLRNRLKFALTRKEVQIIVMNRLIKVDGKVRTDMNFPTGFMDVLSIEKTGENYRVLYDTKGRYQLVKVSDQEAQYKLCRVKKLSIGDKNSLGKNPFASGRSASVPYIVTHDGRTLRYPDPLIKPNDTIKLDLVNNKIVDFVKFELGALVMITGGHNQGRVGVITHRDRHPGSFDIVHVKDKRGQEFATRLGNVFVIGKGKESWVKLPSGDGIALTILEERDQRYKKAETA